MHEDIFVVSYLDGLRPVHTTVTAASAVQALCIVQRSLCALGHESAGLMIELLCPGTLLAAQA
jgi:hypothetical protein